MIYDLELAAYNSIIANNYFNQAQLNQDGEYVNGDLASYTADLARFETEFSAWKASNAAFDQQFAKYIADEEKFFNVECGPDPLP